MRARVFEESRRRQAKLLSISQCRVKWLGKGLQTGKEGKKKERQKHVPMMNPCAHGGKVPGLHYACSSSAS